MTKILITFLVLWQVACTHLQKDDSSKPYSKEVRIESVFVFGDSLCNTSDAWPDLLREATGVRVGKFCVGGLGIATAYMGEPLSTKEVTALHSDDYDVFIIAMGVNDTSASNEDFEKAYREAYASHPNTVCLLPPLTDIAEYRSRIKELRRIIVDICREVIMPTPSDRSDGIHYTKEAQRLNMEIVRDALGLPYTDDFSRGVGA